MKIFRLKQGAEAGLSKLKLGKTRVEKLSNIVCNHSIYPDDNERVLGYDNTRRYHHKHYRGEITPVDDFVSYHELVERFEKEVKEFIK